jgi:hypothetical protein
MGRAKAVSTAAATDGFGAAPRGNAAINGRAAEERALKEVPEQARTP